MRILAALLLCAGIADDPAIRVAPRGWGDASVEDVAAVLRSTAGAFPGAAFPPIEVSVTTGSPITLFERGPGGEIRIKLSAGPRKWAQLAFQFAHELGHVQCGYAEYVNPNLWFEETLCEAASLFALGRLAESWKTEPPYPNWKSYAESLRAYRDERLARGKLPEGVPLAAFVREHEAALRRDPERREDNLRMAAAILPLFEEDPSGWSGLATLNAVRGDATRSLEAYLRDWHRSAPEPRRAFLRALAGRFGIAIVP